MNVSDIMTVGAVTVRPDTTIAHAARLMLDHRISGLPVVNARGKLVGILSEGDLLHRREIGTEHHPGKRLEHWLASGELARRYAQEHGRKVEEVMTRDVFSVEPHTPVSEVIELMEAHSVRRLPVVDDGKVVGVVSRSNLLSLLLREAHEGAHQTADDSAIRNAILDELAREGWAAAAAIDIAVRGGVVTLEGTATAERVREAVRVVAENAPGVVRVVDNIHVVAGTAG